MGTIHLNSSGLKFESKKEKIQLNWIRPLVGFHKPTPSNITLGQIVDEWIGVYDNHLEFWIKGVPENTPGFKFGKIGITDLVTEHSRHHTITYYVTHIVVEGKLIRQQKNHEVRSRDPHYSEDDLLYLEGPDKLVKKFFLLMKSAMRKALTSEASKAKSAS